MSDELDITAQRLIAAYLHLTPTQRTEIQAQMKELGIRGGLKAGISRLAGMRQPSILSDMFAGRQRGLRYLDRIGPLLGVTVSWLEGDDREPPDWAMQPGDAYQRLCRDLRRTWRQRRGLPTLDREDPSDEDSNSNRMWTMWLKDEEEPLHIDPKGRRLVSEGLSLPMMSEDVDWLAASRYERVAFDLILRFNDWLGLPRIHHAGIFRAGHKAVQIARAHQEWLAQILEARMEQLLIPSGIFAEVRAALCARRKQALAQNEDPVFIEDAIELSWRQQLRRQYGKHRPPIPNAFIDDTGRTAWTDPKVIQHRARLRERGGAWIPEEPGRR